MGPGVGDLECGLDLVMKSFLYVLFLCCIESLPVGQQGPDALQTSKPGRPAGHLPFFSTGTTTVEHVMKSLPPLTQMTGGRLDVGFVWLNGLLHCHINNGLNLTGHLHITGAHNLCCLMQSLQYPAINFFQVLYCF